MAQYKLLKNGVFRVADGASIPSAADNKDWDEYQKWLAAGNTPDPADPDPASIDQGDLDNIQRHIKASVLAAAIMSGKTVAQAKAAFRTAINSLP